MKSWAEKFRSYDTAVALIVDDGPAPILYSELAREVRNWIEKLREQDVGKGSVVAFPAIYNLEYVSLLFALIELSATSVPLPSENGVEVERMLEIAQTTHRVVRGEISMENRLLSSGKHALYRILEDHDHPGIVLFTSGTAGQPKAAVHDLAALCSRYDTPRRSAKMIVFMQLDHIGGLNTLLFIMSNGGTAIIPSARDPDKVCQAIQRHRVQVLPTSPTFLNLMIISGSLEEYDLSSLERITYGSEPMPSSVLARIAKELPNVNLLQTYGTTELGILKSQSRDDGSLWMKVGGEGFDVKIVDGRLWIRAKTAMLGYLNSPSPFDEFGYMDTGDHVEVDGAWIRILGRRSELINVGGLKVSPVEVESVLLEMPHVLEAAVRGESNPITGQIVSAVVRLSSTTESLREFKARMRLFCHGRIPKHAIPARVTLTSDVLVTARFKRSH